MYSTCVTRHTHICTYTYTHTHTHTHKNSPIVSTDAVDSVSTSLASLKSMAAQVVAATSSHGVATSSTAGASGFPHLDSKQPDTVDQALRRKQLHYEKSHSANFY